MTDLGQQIASTQSDSARHALAYGRFEELMTETDGLVPNVQKIVRCVFDQYGRPTETSRDTSAYANTATSMFRTYLTTRDRHLKVMTQHDLADYKKEIGALSVETASRNFIKQCFERIYMEDNLFARIFGVEPAWSSDPKSAFQIIKGINTAMVHPGHLNPLGVALQSNLQSADLTITCNVVGWLASEYSVVEVEEDESPFFRKSKEYAAQLLVWNLWPFTDSCFDGEITKSITKAVVQDGALAIAPVSGDVASSNAYPLVKRAIALLAMFDQAMPKERSVCSKTLLQLPYDMRALADAPHQITGQG